MKKLLLALLLFVSYSSLNAGVIPIQNFDTPPITNMTVAGPGTWTIDTGLYVSPHNSYRGQYPLNGYTTLESNAGLIDATNNAFVVLNFKQICKLEIVDYGQIEISINGGLTWVKLYDHGPGMRNCIYLGTSPSFAANENFNTASYALDWDPANDLAVPVNSWWRQESFDISQLAANQPDVRIRFKAVDAGNFPDPNALTPDYGWLLDDINVQIATCELNPPVFTNVTPVLSGTIYSLGTQELHVFLADASGIGSVELYWTVNNGPLQQFGGLADLGAGEYAGVISNNGVDFNNLDTICFYVEAFDASGCNNVAYYPFTGPSTCQTFIVSSGVTIPYCDNFDGPNPVWKADSTSTGDLWKLGAPTGVTLSTPHSAPNVWGIPLTSQYLAGDESFLVSPVLDFSTTPVANLSFWWTSNTDEFIAGVRLEYNLDQNNPNWQVLGTYPNDPNGTNWYPADELFPTNLPAWQGTHPWTKSSYKLGSVPGLGGATTGVQFRYVFDSDAFLTPLDGFLIDDFCIVVPPKNDIGVSAYIQPPAGSGQAAGASVPFSVNVENFGTDPQTTFNIGFSVTGQSNVTVAYVGPVLAVNSSNPVVLPNITVPQGAFTICTWTDLSGDGDHTNDTLCSNYVGVSTITPSDCDDFEGINQGWVNVSVGTPGNDFLLGTPAHTTLTSANSGINAWDINLTGANYGDDADVFLYSPFYDFHLVANGSLSFYLNYEIENSWDGLRLDYSNDGGSSWNVLGTGSATTPDPCGTNWYNDDIITSSTQVGWTGTTGGWRKSSYKLCCTNGILLSTNLVQFRFEFTSDGSNPLPHEGVSIDDFCVTSSTGDDVGVSAITAPAVGGYPVGIYTHVSVTITNYGSTVISSTPVTYFAGGSAHTYTYTGSIPLCGSATFSFPDSILVVQGQNDICAYTELLSDVNHGNDTTCSYIVGQPKITVTYSSSFKDNLENGNVGFAPAVDPTGTPGSIWELGTPNYGANTGAHSPVNAWDVNLSTGTTNDALTYLVTPYFQFKGIANSQHATLRFWQNRNMNIFNDEFNIEYKIGATGGTWKVLGAAASPNTKNWYNNGTFWDDESGGWIQSSFQDVDALVGADSIIQFRFTYTGGFTSTDGISVDDIEVFVPLPLSITPLSVNLSSQNTLILPGQQLNFSSPIYNNGFNPVFIHSATLTIDGVFIQTDIINYTGGLNSDDTLIHQFNSTWISSPGFHQACVYTTGPNGTTDYNLADDTICSSILVFDSVTTNQLPYCNDFESGSQWVTLDAISYTPNTYFQLGTPGQTNLNTAHSGQNAWTISLDSNYVNRDSSGLFSSLLRVQTGHCYELNFFQQFRTEFGSDGGTVEYSDDLGVTWKRIDFTGTANIITSGGPGTNYSYVVSLDPADPSKKGFTGTTNGWLYTVQTIRPNIDGQIIIRWRFASDYSARDEGWTIDDFCFKDLGLCSPIGIDEYAYNDFGISQNYPNPTNGNTTIEYMIPQAGNVTIEITDMIGQAIAIPISGNVSEGKHVLDLNTSDLSAGVYTYIMKYDNRQITKRMIITK